MTIDAKELREAIEHVRTRETWNISPAEKARQALLAEAASLYLATLPREVEIEVWARVDNEGVMVGFAQQREPVEEAASTFGGHAVRLTGTATLTPREKD
jgi:hypothetical protein